MEITSLISEPSELNSTEKVVLSQHEPVTGVVTPYAYVTIHDDGDNDCVFLYSQIDDIVAALREVQKTYEFGQQFKDRVSEPS
jgi:hypothetical protein